MDILWQLPKRSNYRFFRNQLVMAFLVQLPKSEKFRKKFQVFCPFNGYHMQLVATINQTNYNFPNDLPFFFISVSDNRFAEFLLWSFESIVAKLIGAGTNSIFVYVIYIKFDQKKKDFLFSRNLNIRAFCFLKLSNICYQKFSKCAQQGITPPVFECFFKSRIDEGREFSSNCHHLLQLKVTILT